MDDRNKIIIDKYVKGIDAKTLGNEYSISERQVQRIVRRAGVIRTRSESYILAIKQGRMKYHYKPEHLKAKRTTVSIKLRYKILIRDGYKCVICGRTAKEAHRIEIDHINGDATNNSESNLQVVCDLCNKGKAYNLVS